MIDYKQSNREKRLLAEMRKGRREKEKNRQSISLEEFTKIFIRESFPEYTHDPTYRRIWQSRIKNDDAYLMDKKSKDILNKLHEKYVICDVE